MIGSICILVRRPKGEESSTLGVRTAWATHMGAIDTKILFLEDGVFNLLQNPGYHTDMLKKFIDEGGKAYCVQSHLHERGLPEVGVLQGVALVSDEDVPEMLEECDAVATF